MADEKLQVSRAEKIKAAILGSFAADAHSLGFHWVYDTDQISKPVPAELVAPHSQFHANSGKKLGDLTHEGDQELALLKSIAHKKAFDLADFANRFQKLFTPADYKGWKTHAVKHTLEDLAAGKPPSGSDIDDTNNAGKFLPLLLVAQTADEYARLAKQAASYTYHNAAVDIVIDFFAHVLFAVLDGASPSAAVSQVAQQAPFSSNAVISAGVASGIASKDEDTTAVFKRNGQNCSIKGGLPNVIHLLFKYNDVTAALLANQAAGGDTQGRSTIIGALFGAYKGSAGLPAWSSSFTSYNEVVQLIDATVGGAAAAAAADKKLSFEDRIAGAILGSFAADAYALGYHWVYDISQIQTPVPAELLAPHSQYHANAGKKKGDFTHEGDQMLLLLRSVVEKKSLDVNDYIERFKALFTADYKGWKTHAVKGALQQISDGKLPTGADVDDCGPSSRLPPLVLVAKNPDQLAELGKKWVGLLYNGTPVLDSVDFFAHVLWQVLEGKHPVAAIQDVIKIAPFKENADLVQAINAGFESKNEDTVGVVKRVGQSCSIKFGLPNTFHLLAKYSDLASALSANAAAGGDSQSRAALVGMLLGAYYGPGGLPAYATQYSAYEEVAKLVQAGLALRRSL